MITLQPASFIGDHARRRMSVGIGAITDGKMHPVAPRGQPLMTHFGLIRGTIAFVMLRLELHKPPRRTGVNALIHLRHERLGRAALA